ncbi:hypothetical protein [Maribacter sp. HTCC2170]|uniref:hypothetical protein n=1 Tax=Maribacter sp. (strain HTCC2170 / KCCM 42371) TaxID=313603 RepID=UPI00006BD272|nr:hypothetical protein [Maribacter sp. HTCC2170]EAR02965.1 hypothetical protein FB2170_06740 [Maribacter sp. HTCC2170]
MIEDELIQIWQSSPEQEQIKFEKSRLMLDMQSSLDRFHRLIKYSLLVEQIAVIIIIPVFLFIVYWVPPVLSKIASFLIVLWAIWYMFRLRKIKEKQPKSILLNYLDYLKKNRGYLRYLKNMTDTAMYWYILPPMTGYFMFIIGAHLYAKGPTAFFLLTLLLGMGASIAYYLYFRWIVKKIYMPRLQKIDSLIKTLEE